MPLHVLYAVDTLLRAREVSVKLLCMAIACPSLKNTRLDPNCRLVSCKPLP